MNEDNNRFEFDATITFCRFYNPDSMWGVYRFSTEHDLPYLDGSTWSSFGNSTEKDRSVRFGSLVGKVQELNVGCKYHISAHLNSSKYGWEYVPENVTAIAPRNRDEQLMFLSTFISPKIAENVLNKYPNIVNDVISGEIEDIDYSDINGVAEKTWLKIRDKITDNFMIADIIVMLRPLGISFNTIKSLLGVEKNVSVLKKKITDNPYILTKLHGFGFKRVDDFAVKIRPDIIDSPQRLIAFMRYYFIDLGENTGDTWCELNELIDEVNINVPECRSHMKEILNSSDMFTISGGKVGLSRYREIELEIFNSLKKKSEQPWRLSISQTTINESIREAEEIQGFTYSDEQKNVINNVLRNNVSIISGKAGVGKSSIMRAIITSLKKSGLTFSSCALSAMAAKRIEEASGFYSQTIHRTLGSNGENRFEFNEESPLTSDVLIVDEGSMIGASLFHSLIKATRDNTVIIISGDNKQLPPIGYGNIFYDLIESLNPSSVNTLTEPMRQAKESGILVDANMVRENVSPIEEENIPKVIHGNLHDMYYMFRNDRDTLSRIAISTYIKSVKTDGSDNVVIITPRKQGCENSSSVINQKIQYLIMKNRSDDEKITCGESGSKMFYVGDRVIQTVNNYSRGVFNGDVGYVTEIESILENGNEIKICEITFNNVKESDGSPKKLKYKSNELDDIELAYSLTCHKIQGAGIKTVIGIIDNTHYSLLDNCMLYTLMTRAKKRCLLLAEPTAFQMCIRKSHNDRRTWLSLENNNIEENAS